MTMKVTLTRRAANILAEYRAEVGAQTDDLALNLLVIDYARLKQEAWMAEQFKSGGRLVFLAELQAMFEQHALSQEETRKDTDPQ